MSIWERDEREELFNESKDIIEILEQLPKHYLLGIGSIVQNNVDIPMKQIQENNEQFEKRVKQLKEDYKEGIKKLIDWNQRVEKHLLDKLE